MDGCHISKDFKAHDLHVGCICKKTYSCERGQSLTLFVRHAHVVESSCWAMFRLCSKERGSGLAARALFITYPTREFFDKIIH
jgi:hypothetical protein